VSRTLSGYDSCASFSGLETVAELAVVDSSLVMGGQRWGFLDRDMLVS
jgi:hypothetical protein